ncbi:EAL domain-containing protein [Planktothrix sp. FACHB-1355]|uniref:EAL domain-containing protein n=1 Tax=Aerosakkonema funiforme FACHB-1375 TaxID=2949571 RepID=A0A926VDU1_9CYAN|nr:EAL domain-containing protein [Aerosakkonema funiforme]MBD2181945.1 EAL domain-containing protein [Aerosakkonema funiforme FACHB-1375]MBD3558295.1 EAL domain-containing protein [Planktothrix sp. FACHB-1355]
MTDRLSKKIHSLLLAARNQETLGKLTQIVALVWQKPVLTGSLLIAGLLLGVRQLEVLQPLELVEFDRATQFQPELEPDPRILVIGITESDLQAQKRSPVSDRTVATLLAKLQSYQPKVIGLDLYRDLPQPPGHAELLKQLQAPNIIAISKLESNDSRNVPPPPGVPKERIGFNDLVLDPDGVIRRNLMYAYTKADKFYSFSLRVSLSYLKDKNLDFKVYSNSLQLGQKTFLRLKPYSGGYQNIGAQGYQILLNYRGRKVARQVNLTQVLNGSIQKEWVKDKVVLIGTTAPSEKDLFFTPYNAIDRQEAAMPGVLVHGQMVSQILSTVLDDRPLFWFWPQWAEALWIWGWSLVGGILVWRFRHPLSLAIAATVAVAGLFVVWFICFTHAVWIPFLVPTLALVTTGGTSGIYKLFYNAFYDPLTGLPNRDLFLKELQKSIDRSKSQVNYLFAVIFLDLDQFKIFNEGLGHQAGDEILRIITQRLKAILHAKYTVARIGGDEFAILLADISNIDLVTLVTDKIQKKLYSPFNLKGQEIFITASFGIAFNQTGHNYKPEELLRDAHTAMYRAKALGKARYEVFSVGMRTQVVSRLQLENDLRRAIASAIEGNSQELSVHYQPIVSLETGKIAGFEALVRWQNSQGKFISPVEFIPVAEETGLIVTLGEWILEQSCRQLRIWQQQFTMQPELTISVNLSSQQFAQPDLIERIEQILKKIGLNGHSLKLEITESMAMKDVDSTIAKILRLKALNLKFSIDDFGTGYSSLSYLHRFPVDTLKVDRSFVSRMEETTEDAAIVQTIVMLSHILGMDVIAEGIETASQMEKLRILQCEYGQGYFFSKPLHAEAATALLSQYTNSV